MWQDLPSHIEPILFELGGFSIRYYGLMYCVALVITYSLSIYRIRKENFELSVHLLDKYLIFAFAGILVGARLGYFIFYDQRVIVEDPLSIIFPFKMAETVHFVGFSGMSYHGGLIGIAIGTLLYSYKTGISVYKISDLIIPSFPLGYMFGRFGNFINSELYGRHTSSFIGMYFPTDPQHLLRHPSQLYEAFGEGLLLFLILWPLRNNTILKEKFLGLYLIAYGAIRFIIEFFREADSQIGYFFTVFTWGQCLCVIMIICGLVLIKTRTEKEIQNAQ